MSNLKGLSMLIRTLQFWIVLRLPLVMASFWDQSAYELTKSYSVHIYAATHSVDAKERDAVLERALPVKIGKNCWMYV